MKRFRFRLHALTKLLKRDLQMKQLQLASAMDEERIAEGKVVELRHAQERAAATPTLHKGRVDLHARDQLALYLAASDQALAEAHQALRHSSAAVDQARSAVQQAQIEVRRIARLRELQRQRHHAAAARREILHLDELGSRRRRD